MKLPFERTPRNALTVSAKRTQKRRFFAKKAEIITHDGAGREIGPAASALLAAKRPEWFLYALEKVDSAYPQSYRARTFPLFLESRKAPSFCSHAIPDGKPLRTFPGIAPGGLGRTAADCRAKRHHTDLEHHTYGACKFIVKL
ncbi:MAG: hypothetical protein QM684_24765 [Rhizobium sp.]